MTPKKSPVTWLFKTLSGRTIRLASEPQRWSTRAGRHESIDIAALRRRRAKNKVGTRSRRINRKRAGR